MYKRLILVLSVILFSACSSMINKKTLQLPTNKKYAISSFWNYTETPMAGLRASSIVESVLAREPIEVHSLVDGSEKIEEERNKQKFLINKKIKP
jgi:uncharacterized lipoprotein YmbA